ncbi:MAG: helix-turn-helix transcriptional regulator [Deltaproteobacteria bacterium]|nr:helix-turn-helix transcriptional regulator [Deltaproteobacteria bacterium]
MARSVQQRSRRPVRHTAAALSPFRLTLLKGLQEPASASGLARRLGVPRQQVNYHLRELEHAGLIELGEARQRRGCTERIMRLTSRVSFPPADAAASPEVRGADQDGHGFSSAHLIAAASAVASEVAELRARAEASGKRLVTTTLQGELSFPTPDDYRAFVEGLTAAVAQLAARHAAPDDPRSRAHRLTITLNPTLQPRSERKAP